MPQRISRRGLIGAAGVAATGVALGTPTPAEARRPKVPWTISLNTSTLRPASLDVKLAAVEQAGYSGIELWSNELTDHAKAGGSLDALGRRIADAGLLVPNIIGLWNCMPEDSSERPATFDRVRKQMEDAAKVGARHIAVVPTPDRPDIDTLWAAERYRELLEIGEEYGVIPAVEFVGFFKGVNRLGQATAIAIEADHPQACLVADTFHLYGGGSGFNGVKCISAPFIACFHINDAPASPPRSEQRDADRVMPGDGVLPLVQLLSDLRANGFAGPLSLEIFNPGYWEQDPFDVAKLGIRKIRALIEESRRLRTDND